MAATIAPAADPRILAGHDIHAQRGEYLFALPKCLISTLEDARDEPLLHLLGNVLLTTLPAAAALFLCGCRQHWIGAIYMILNYVLYMQRFMLTLHFSEHRRLFKKEYAALNFLAPNVLCVLFGIPTGVYRLHHCIIHHVEENSSAHDVSSTEPFQRDNLLHFLLYWMRYTVGAWFELPIYALRRERYGWAAASMSAETAYWAAITLLWRVNPVATMWTLVLPFCLSSFLTMFGNWWGLLAEAGMRVRGTATGVSVRATAGSWPLRHSGAKALRGGAAATPAHILPLQRAAVCQCAQQRPARMPPQPMGEAMNC